MSRIREYAPIVGEEVIDQLFKIAEKLEGKRIININSTAVGGGVAEILSRMIPLLNELGVDATWEVIKGTDEFFNITKTMHNALHGVNVSVTEEQLEYFLEINRQNAKNINLDGDVMFVHDPQPIALVEKRSQFNNKWLWRCHIDVSRPQEWAWNFLKPYVEKYDAAVFSAPAFAQQLPIDQFFISPSIDPLSDKNKDLSKEEIRAVFDKFGIDMNRPTITQVSRFDYLKDPVGVIEAYKHVKKHVDCQLVLAGGTATDDPESEKVLAEVREKAGSDPDIFILLLPPNSDFEINALQRGSTVILQKSIKEGFGLTVTEGLWKARPVVASAVGGITLQIKHKESGILTHTIEGTAYWIKQLIQNPEYANYLGKNGKEYVRNNFLITRHMKEYMLAFLSLFSSGESTVML
ncbi:MAG: glycosyltransferase [Acetomicrobium flavidum]|uniref:Trehalose phosphorylase, putative n=1 Tax=Coprothermobacter proteolyticus (strain ATCC 35245 / DSM 5265 / OCM 4 / BT) TaxID=309798 RepID=B5Y6D0_COPPD|nr:glycosyltransferase [Coprothermobacter proteolyticus]ACI17528.1 glycosyl transferase family 1 [Coprothermobacter proteolyticus DSM 5265]NLG95447.1 glycosyltransferase [Acetomicrobium flavidum]